MQPQIQRVGPIQSNLMQGALKADAASEMNSKRESLYWDPKANFLRHALTWSLA